MKQNYYFECRSSRLGLTIDYVYNVICLWSRSVIHNIDTYTETTSSSNKSGKVWYCQKNPINNYNGSNISTCLIQRSACNHHRTIPLLTYTDRNVPFDLDTSCPCMALYMASCATHVLWCFRCITYVEQVYYTCMSHTSIIHVFPYLQAMCRIYTPVLQYNSTLIIMCWLYTCNTCVHYCFTGVLHNVWCIYVFHTPVPVIHDCHVLQVYEIHKHITHVLHLYHMSNTQLHMHHNFQCWWETFISWWWIVTMNMINTLHT